MSQSMVGGRGSPASAGVVDPPVPYQRNPGVDPDVLERLAPVVFRDAVLRDHLLRSADRDEFCRRLARTAAEHGIELSPAQVGELLHGARRRWIERWL